MSLFINTNVASLIAQNNVANSQDSLTTSIQRLSSGLRINSAKDDAAGYAIAARMTSQIGGMTQAAQNANDGISMAQTAAGALNQVTSDLQTMRNLAVQAANGTNSASDRASLQASISQLQQDIGQIASNTQYNGLNLLNGSLSNVQFQVGANSGQTINTSIATSAPSAIGDNAASTSTGATATSMDAATTVAGSIPTLNNFTAQALTIAVGGQTLTVPPTGQLAAGSTAYDIASQINNAAGASGASITAVANTYAQLSSFTAGSVSLTLQGAPNASGAANPVTVSASLSTATDVGGLAAAINAVSAQTGISAIANTVNGTISLNQSQGYNIGVSNGAASTGTVGFSGTDATGGTIIGGTTQTLVNGPAAIAAVTATQATAAGTAITDPATTNVVVPAGGQTFTFDSNGTTVTGTIAAGTYNSMTTLAGAVSFTGGSASIAYTGTTFTITDTNTAGSTNQLSNFSGAGLATLGLSSPTITQGVAAVTAQPASSNSSTVGGEVDFHSSNSYTVAPVGTNTTFLATATSGTSSLSSVSSIDVTKMVNGLPAGANNAMFVVDGAINTINGLQAQLGALQNRFMNAQSSLTTTSTNMQQARSRIQDTNFASETANLTHNQILQQAGIAMLAQANAMPNSVLTLLK